MSKHLLCDPLVVVIQSLYVRKYKHNNHANNLLKEYQHWYNILIVTIAITHHRFFHHNIQIDSRWRMETDI